MDNEKKQSKMNVIMSNEKTRNVFLISSVVAVLVLGFGFYNMNKQTQVQKGSSQFNPLPSVETTPGESLSPQYNQKLTNKNADEAKAALDKGTSYIPTPVNDKAFNTQSPLDNIAPTKEVENIGNASLRNPIEVAPVPVPTVPEVKAPEPIAVETPVVPQVVRPVAQEIKPKQKYNEQDLVFIKSIVGSLNPSGNFIEYDYTGKNKQQEGVNNVNNAINTVNGNNPVLAGNSQVEQNQADTSKTLIKAGNVIHAVLETGINSDEPSPVLAKVISGDLKGAKLLGQMTRNGKKVIVQFNTISIPEYTSSLAINAVAVDADTRRTALASEVDNHYLQRYGILLAATFLKGYAEAVSNQGTTTSVNALGGVTVTSPSLNNKQITQKAVGDVGKELAEQTKATLNPNPTVTVHPGVAIGVLLMNDLKVQVQK